MCIIVDVEQKLLSVCGRQQHRNNLSFFTPLENYWCNILRPFFDHLLLEMANLFTTHHRTALNGICLVPPVLVTLSFNEVREKIIKFADMHRIDLPSPDSVEGEVHNWKIKWQQQFDKHRSGSLPSSPAWILKLASCMFINVHVLLKILYTLPITSCSSESSHSSLKLIKIPVRSTMSNEWLTSLSLLQIYWDISNH